MIEKRLSKVSREWSNAIKSANSAVEVAQTLVRIAPLRMRTLAQTKLDDAIKAREDLLANLSAQSASFNTQSQS